MNRENLILQLKALQPIILEGYHAELRGIFGSWARNEQQTNSDLDVLVCFLPGATLLDLSGLRIYLEEELQIPIDLVSEKGVHKDIEPYIYKDLISI